MYVPGKSHTSALVPVSTHTAANSIYYPPYLQAQLDLQSSALHTEDKDYKMVWVSGLERKGIS